MPFRYLTCLLMTILSMRVFSAQAPLNIVVILADDLGWRDVSYAGSEFYETPRIDELASTSMVFTQAYAAHPRCVPSR